MTATAQKTSNGFVLPYSFMKDWPFVSLVGASSVCVGLLLLPFSQQQHPYRDGPVLLSHSVSAGCLFNC